MSYQPVEGRRKNLLLTYRPTERPSHRLLLAPHMDTVVADAQQLTPLLKNGRLYGRGACDTKGSIASMFDALVDLIASPNRPKQTEIQLAGQLNLCLFGSVRGSDQIHESIEHGGNASLGIAGSPAVEPSVLEEWGQLLCVGHHRIHVRGEQQAVTGTFRGSIGQKKVFASALDGLIAHGKTFSPTQFRKKRSHPTFT